MAVGAQETRQRTSLNIETPPAAAGSLKSRVPREILLGTGVSAAAGSLKSRVPREILLGTGVSAAAGTLKSRVVCTHGFGFFSFFCFGLQGNCPPSVRWQRYRTNLMCALALAAFSTCISYSLGKRAIHKRLVVCWLVGP